MNICIVYGSGAVGLNSRLNKRFEPLQSVAGDDVIAFRSLASFDDASSSNYSVYIFHNCFDARSSLLIHSLFSKGKIIGVDLPVLADLPKPEIQSQWLKSVISSVDFITTDTGQHFEPLIDGAEHIPVFVVPRPNNSTGKDNLVATVAERRRYMSLSRHINICWIGSGVRDIDTEGLKDAVAFGATLAEVQRRGYEASLNIVAHQDALDTRMLSALKTLPIRWKAEAWSEEIEEKRQRQSLVTYLPFNSRAQSRAYAHDRAEAAVANGSRVYCPLPPLDGEFSTFTYRSLSALISDLESSAASVANDTETAVVSGASGAGDAYHPLHRLIDFLCQLTPGDRVKSPPLIAVIHGQTSTVPIHKFAQRTGHLSVVTSSFAHSVSTDLDLAYDTESDTLWAILSPTASAHLSELFRGLLEEDVGGGKKARRRLPLNHLPRKLIAELRSECLGIPAFLSPSAYIERLDLYQELIGHLFPGAIPIISEPGEPIAVVATRRPKPTGKLNEGASQTKLEAAKRPTLKVAWLVQKLDFSSASVRYRSLHMAMAMGHLDTRHSYFTDIRKLVEKIDQFDVVVIVKRLEPSILSVLAAGKSGETAFFLDLCDDMLSPFYRREGSAQNQMVFAAAASMLDGVIVPSVEMASHIRTYCRNKKVSRVKVFVVPDIAETPELFAEARDFFVGLTDQAARPLPYLQAFRQVNLPAKVASRANPMRVVWFGNFGSPHSNFGIPSLLSAVSALQKVSQDIPLELTVISNDKNRFTAILADCGVPTRYVPWAEDTIYDQLRQADLALLTNGDDEFSKLKSANRALLALALGIPVVATGNAAMRKLVPAIWADDYETGLRKYLGQDRNEEIATALSHAQTILRRYDLSSNARRWRRILTATIASKRHRPKAENGRKALIFVEFGFAADLLRDAVRNYRSSNILPMITVNGATPINPALLKVLIELEILPTVLMPDDLKTHDVRWLRGAGEILVEAPNGAMSKQLISWAHASGMVVKSLGASGESGNRSPSEPSMKSHKEGPIVGLSPIYSDPSQVPILGGEAFLRRTSQIAAQRQQSFAVPHSSVLHR